MLFWTLDSMFPVWLSNLQGLLILGAVGYFAGLADPLG